MSQSFRLVSRLPIFLMLLVAVTASEHRISSSLQRHRPSRLPIDTNQARCGFHVAFRSRGAARERLRRQIRRRSRAASERIPGVRGRSRQQIEFFNERDVPVAIGLVIDNSSSMITRRPMIVAGGSAFAESSHAATRLFTIVFNETVQIRASARDAVHQDPAHASVVARSAHGRAARRRCTMR